MFQELTEGLEGESGCSKCDFQASSSNAKMATKILALHHVTDHGGAELDELLKDLPLVQVPNTNGVIYYFRLYCSII